MNNWKNLEIGKAIDFNPSESIKKGTNAKKIPMDKLKAFVKKIDGFEFSEYSAGPKFRNGDTLLAKITPCLENGKTAQVNILEENEVAFGSSEFIVLRENENTVNDFIFYLAKSPAFRKRAISCMEGTSGRKRVNEGALKLQILPIPDKRTQIKISKVLCDLDAKIEINNRINSELEAMARVLYDYWFVQFDFPDANGNPYKTSGGKMVWNEELRREIPNGWEAKELKQILYTVNESIEPNQFLDLKYLPIDKLPRKKLYYQEYSERENANSSLIKFNEDDILLGAMRVYFHRVCNAIEDGISRSTIMVLRSFDSMYKNYGLFTLSKDETIDFANKNSTGTSIPYAKWENGLSLFKVAIPSEVLLKDFNKQIDPILTQFKILCKENQELASLRDWLLPMLMNGQVTVTEAEEKLGMVAESKVEYKKL